MLASSCGDIKTCGRGLSEPRAWQASEHTPGALLSHITQHPPPQISLLPHYWMQLGHENAALNHKVLILWQILPRISFHISHGYTVKKKGSRHIMKTRSAHLGQILVWHDFSLCLVNVFSIGAGIIKFKQTGPDDGGSIHSENMNETSRAFILQWCFKRVWQPVGSEPLNREVRNQSPQAQVLTSFHSRVWSIAGAWVSAASVHYPDQQLDQYHGASNVCEPLKWIGSLTW